RWCKAGEEQLRSWKHDASGFTFVTAGLCHPFRAKAPSTQRIAKKSERVRFASLGVLCDFARDLAVVTPADQAYTPAMLTHTVKPRHQEKATMNRTVLNRILLIAFVAVVCQPCRAADVDTSKLVEIKTKMQAFVDSHDLAGAV